MSIVKNIISLHAITSYEEMPVPPTRWKVWTNIYRETLASNIGQRNRLFYMSRELSFNNK